MHPRRPLPALALVLPHPPLISHLTDALTPRTPRACSPSTPVLFPRQLVTSPRTSTDSWGSSTGNGDDEVQWEWKPEQMSLLVRTLDVLPGHLWTPFNGPVPPSNLLDKLARSVIQTQGPLEWPHSVRATRAKLAEIARARDKGRSKENMTIDEQDEESSNRQPNSKRPLYRQSSMDFLPSKDKCSGSLSRLSSRLQRTDRMINTYHPYARPASRSPSPPALTPRSQSPRQDYCPRTPTFASTFPHNSKSLRSRVSSNSLGSRPSQALRRSISVTSTMSSNSNPVPTSTLAGPTTAGILAPMRPIRRSDSFTCAELTGLPSLKRAPSFGATSIASGMSKLSSNEKQAQEPESDEEEKVREKKVKRPRTRSTTAATGGPEKKKRGEREKKLKDTKSPSSVVPASPNKPKARSKPVRSGSMFGAELPQPQVQRTLPGAVTPPSSPKTLRRVKTTTFNLGPCPPGKRISFGSLAQEQECESKDAPAPALGSAFQLS